MRALAGHSAAVVFLLGGQIALALTLRHDFPRRDVLPPLPSAHMADAQAFGDRQYFFRSAALDIQSAGDTGGRVVPIKNYDFDLLLGWMRLLEQFDPRSVIPVSLTAGYFGASQDATKLPAVVQFIRESVAKDPVQRWKLLFDAIYIAERRLGDPRLAVEIALQLSAYGPDVVPQVAAMAPAFVYEHLEERENAHAIVDDVRRRYEGRVTPAEQEWSLQYLNYLEGRGPRPR